MSKFVKRFFELAVLLLCIVTLVGCSSDESSASNAGSNSTDSNEAVKVGFIYIGVPGDEGFTYAHDEGRKEAISILADKDITMETSVIESISDNDSEATKTAIDNLVNQGCDIIFTASFGYMDTTLEAAEEYPDVDFMHCSGYKTADNMSNYFGKIYQERYLCGIVAGEKFNELVEAGTLTAEECKVGYEAAFAIPEVVRGIDAFTLGLQSVCPSATVEVKFTSTWYNPDIEYSNAKALIDNGCHIIMQHQDTTKPQIAAEEAYALTGDVFSIGYHSDMAFRASNANLCSAVWSFGDYYASQVEAVANGTWASDSYWGGIETGVVDMVFNEDNTNLPEGIVAEIETAKQTLIDGDVIFSGKIELESNKNASGDVIEGVTTEDGKYYYDCGTGLADSYLSGTISWFVKGVTVLN